MFTRKFSPCVIVCLLVTGSISAFAQAPNLGKPITPGEIAAWDINVLPDGTGLPTGSGKAADGARIYSAKCSMCHGENGKGGSNARLVGTDPIKDMESEKTIANFWPFATTLFDYIRRAMPWRQPKTLSNDEVYALTAYILSLNKLIGENDTMNAQTLPRVRMPNREGFVVRFPDRQ
jgi:S-disulfanyl-L-cysteine oxidoreductase SoxD